jgi:hypothetical protein
MATEDFYREFQRRRHKLLGAYLALRAWERKVDCVALSHIALRPYLDLKEIEEKRLSWLKEDLKGLFPYSLSTENAKPKRFDTLYLSRVELPKEAETWSASGDLEFAALFEEEGLRIGILDEIPSESEIIRIMADISHGISDFARWQEEALMNDEPARYLRECKRFGW